MSTFSDATERFLAALKETGKFEETDEPLAVGLRAAAKDLDTAYSNATYSQFRATWRALMRRDTAGRPKVLDPLEELLG